MQQKIFFPLLFLALIMTTSLQACQSVRAEGGGYETIDIQTSAVCGTCKMTLEKAFQDVEGVKWARLDLGNKMMTIKYNPETIDSDGLRHIISETGYDADEVPANAEIHDNLPGCCQKGSGAH